MNYSNQKPRTRREFLRGAGRGAAAGALALIGGLLAVRRLWAGDKADCVIRNPCGNCLTFGACELPRATAARATLKES